MKLNLLMENCVEENGYIYFMAMEMNALCKICIEDKSLEIISSVPNASFFSKRFCVKIYKLNENLYLAPFNSKSFWKYNLDTKTWKEIVIKMENCETDLFFQGIKYNNKLFFVGSNYPAIVCVDPVDDSIKYIEQPYKRKLDIKKSVNDYFFRTDYLLRDNLLYLPSVIDNEILILNLDSCGFEWKKVGVSGYRFSGIVWDDNAFLITLRHGNKLIKWDGDTKWDVIDLNEKFQNENFSFEGCYRIDDKILLPALFHGKTVEIDMVSKEMILIDENYVFFEQTDSNQYVSLTTGGKLKTHMHNKDYVIEMEFDDIIIQKYLLQTKAKVNLGGCIITEGKELSLNTFLNTVLV